MVKINNMRTLTRTYGFVNAKKPGPLGHRSDCIAKEGGVRLLPEKVISSKWALILDAGTHFLTAAHPQNILGLAEAENHEREMVVHG